MHKFKEKLYSTGPIENATGTNPGSTLSSTVFVKVLNDDDHFAYTKIKLFALNGTKREMDRKFLKIPPEASGFVIFDVSGLFEFEVQILVEDDHEVLASVWGKDATGNIVAAHRLVHEELVKMPIPFDDCKDY